MYVAKIPNRNSPPTFLLRESYREGGKVKNRTVANITHLPHAQIDGLTRVLKGETLINPKEAFQVTRSLPHGHVAAVLGTLRKLHLDDVLAARSSTERTLVEAMIVARVIDPTSKLATARCLHTATMTNSLAEVLQLEDVQAEQLYAAMDWLHARQARIENKLAKKHLVDGALILYDLTSTYFEGRCCPLAKHGHSRDGKRDKLQIEFGLLCNAEGCPIAVHVFEGNTSDPATVSHQIETLRKRFGLKRFILIGDRGMLTEARVREDLSAHEGIDWITALRAPAIRQLYASKQIQMSLFDERNLAEIIDPERANERLVVCLNPQLRDERRRKRGALLAATELELDKIVKATVRTNRPLRGKVPIGLRVGKVLNRFKVAKHFLLTIEDESFHYQRDHQNIADEEAVDGLYVVRSSLAKDAMSSNELVKNYKRLASVERVFRSMKSVDLKVRPIHHHLENRVRAHVFLCMLAYYVEWHMRQSLAEVLFDDNEKDAAEKLRQTAADLAVRSPSAMEKARSKQTPDGLPVHSFQTLLSDLATITRNHLTFHSDNPAHQVTYCETTQLTPVQQRAIDLLQVSLHKER